MSAWRFAYSALIACMTSIRCVRLVLDQLAKAFRAALTALSTSAADPMEILPETASVAGLMTSEVLGSTGSTQRPSMYNFRYSRMARPIHLFIAGSDARHQQRYGY